MGCIKGALTRVLREHLDIVTAVVCSPDGRFLASTSEDKDAIVWETHTWEPLWSKKYFSSVVSVDFSLDSSMVAILKSDLVRMGSSDRQYSLQSKSGI